MTLQDTQFTGGKTPTAVPLPHLVFDTSRFDAVDRLDALNTFSLGLYIYCPQTKDGTAPHLSLDAWALGDIAAASVEYGPAELQAPGRLASDFEDMVFLRLVKSGQVRVACEDTGRVFGPGSIFLTRPQHKLHALNHGTALSLRLPLHRIGFDPLKTASLIELRRDVWQVRVLISAIEALFEMLPDMVITDATDVTTQIAALLRASLAFTVAAPHLHDAVQQSRALAMRRFLSANLARPDLNSEHLEAEFSASRSTVYRAFEDVGGVTSFLRERRLAAIHKNLGETPPRRGVIRRIAERHGFLDQTKFSRSFLARYGQRPGDVLGCALAGRSDANRAHTGRALGAPSLASFWRG